MKKTLLALAFLILPFSLAFSQGSLGNMALQNKNAVQITGGTINGTVIGGVTPAAGTFTTIAGALTGNVTGNVSGNAGTITLANEATDTTCFIIFATTATGNLPLKTNAGVSFNSNTGVLSATGFSGPLTGNVTGNLAGDIGSSTATTQSPNDNSTKTATTAYVDEAVTSQNYKEAAKYASTAALPSIVYANGSSGVGATLTGVALAAISLDSSSPSVGDRVLIKNQASTFQNGIYTVTATGSGIAVFVLTRATDADQANEWKTGDAVFVTAGTTQSATTWAYTGIDSPTMGTDVITFVQVAGQGSFTGTANQVIITGTTFSTPQDIATGSSPQFAGVNVGHASDTTIARSSAGHISIEGSVAGLASDNLGFFTASTSAAIGVGSIELGHASDTTLSRVSAGVIAVEGVTILTTTAIDDTAYDATTWNGDTTHAPSKNAVRDKIESMSSGAMAYILIREEQAQNTSGGTFTSGAWQTRVLNTEASDTGSDASLASNQITLSAGTYRCRISAPAYQCNRHQARLFNTTDSSVILVGTSEWGSVAGDNQTASVIVGRFTIAASKALEVQHQCATTSTTRGFGVEANLTTEVYTIVEIWKE